MALPNWKLLIAFEAVARNGTFSRAAAELNVQQPAMSRRVSALEEELGVRLLHRTRPSVTLTDEGQTLFHAVSGGLMQVRMAVEQIRLPTARNTVVVDTTIGFASCYLMQRLPEFRTAHTDIVVELVSRDLSDRYQDGKSDVIILFDEVERLPGVRKGLIFNEEMVPLCAPGYLVDRVDPAQLPKYRLLHLAHSPHSRDWERYMAGTGMAIAPPGSSERFTSFMVYLQAALNGDGIILGWEHLLQDAIADGKLVRACARQVRSNRGYYACVTERAAGNAAASAFVDWISRTPSGDTRSARR